MRRVELSLGVMTILAACFVGGCPEPRRCLAEGVPVSTPLGAIDIDQLVVGDAVWSVDVADGSLVEARVSAKSSERSKCGHIERPGGRVIWLTGSHPVWSPKERDYVEAQAAFKEESASVWLWDESKWSAERLVAGIPTRDCDVYDITVDSPYSNFIADGVLVHNKSLPPDPCRDVGGGTGWTCEFGSGDRVRCLDGEVVERSPCPVGYVCQWDSCVALSDGNASDGADGGGDQDAIGDGD